MSSIDWMPELAATLDRLVPPADGSRADWGDVVDRAGSRRKPGVPRARRVPIGRTRLVLVAVVLLLLLVGTAMTMYYVLFQGPAGLVVFRAGGFAVLDAGGHSREIGRWRCPRDLFCGDVAGWALSSNGRRLAMSSDELGARSTYPGLHIIDLKTGADRRIPALRRYYATASFRTLRRVIREDTRVLGCPVPNYLSWSPDGSQLAYTCWGGWHGTRGIFTIGVDGTGRRRLSPPHFNLAFSPTWSPDGTQIAFSTGETPRQSFVYVVGLDGRGMRRLAAGALPRWSPNGKAILYSAPGCGTTARSSWRIRLVTPAGGDATPSHGRCAGIGPRGSVIASWSPGGGRIAVKTRSALYVMNADGTRLERVRRGNFLEIGPSGGGFLPPLWRSS
ncbi:MAG TPA: hypothetical protein VGI69_03890 [Gaiellaceae bacterium]|jgi:hypothetical protein